MKSKALFLDRDGVINIEKNYTYKIDEFEFCNGIFEVIKFFQNRGFLIFVITNQAGIGRGLFKLKEFKILTNWMLNRLKQKNIIISRVYHCPHSPQIKCQCRKPNNKMIEDAISFYDIDRKNSWMIGDKISDMEASKKSNIGNSIFITEKKTNVQDISFIVKSVSDINKFLPHIL